jgi:hypothetical protein
MLYVKMLEATVVPKNFNRFKWFSFYISIFVLLGILQMLP